MVKFPSIPTVYPKGNGIESLPTAVRQPAVYRLAYTSADPWHNHRSDKRSDATKIGFWVKAKAESTETD